MAWQPADKIVVALFNFAAQGEHQLALEVGDVMCVLEEQGSWYRGHPFHDPSSTGIFPSCVVHRKEHTSIQIGNKSHLVPAEDEVVLETTHLLREWKKKLYEFYVDGKQSKYKALLGQMEDILSSRRHLIKSNATLDVLQSLRTKLTIKLDQVNNFLSLPVSPRDDNGKLLNCYSTGLHRLYRVHKDRKKEMDQHVSQTGALNRKEEDFSSSTSIHHLFVSINKVDHDPPEECEVFFFLYNFEKLLQVSERFLIHIGGGSRKVSEEHATDKRAVLFTDLGSKDLNTSGMHLVCQLVRKGKMLVDDKKNIAQTPYRRPYACGALEVSSLLQSTEDQDKLLHEEEFKNASFSMPLYLCAANHESDFASFHTTIIKKTLGKAGQKPGCAISMTVKAFHGDLNEVKKNYPSTFERPLEMVHKLGFPDVILPGDVRNDIYITVEHGTFEKGNKRSERNVEVAIEVFDGSRKVIPGAIVLAAGARHSNEYESFVFYHNNTPRWTETFKLSIPFEKLPDAHLRICFRHVAKAEAKDKSEKTFAFAFMKIMRDDGSIIADGPHELYVYKADHKRWFDPKTYLAYASCKEDVISNRSSQTFSPKSMDALSAGAGGVTVSRSFKETITISTLTCSTKLTQKIELLMLLKWRQREKDLSVVLTNMLHIGGEEVVKFLQDTLDCLFDILSTNQEVYGEKIFEVLVAIFGLMQDDKYHHFKTVLDIYISKHFSAALAHRFLVWCFEKHVREYGHIPNLHSKKLCPVLKSMQYLFRFMIQSHTLYLKANKKEDSTFREELKQVFGTLSLLMGYQENKVKDVYLVQSIVLSNLPPVLVDVVKVLSENTIAVLISQFLDSIRNTHATLPRDKLQFMLSIMDSPLKLFHSPKPRAHLLPTYISHLTAYIGHTMPLTNLKPEVQSNIDCMTCVGRVVEVLSEEEVQASDEDIETVVTLLLSLLRLSKTIAKNNPLYNQNMVNLIGLLHVMRDKHYGSLFATQKSTFGSTLKDFLTDFMLAITNIIKYPIFPPTWATMYLMQGKVLSRALSNVAKSLLDSFLDAHSFNPLIWDEFFSVCTSFATQECLQLEVYSVYRRNLYMQQFGDLRVSIAKQIILLWHKLGVHKGQFIPDLINPFLKLSLLKQQDLRRIAIPLIFDIIKCEQSVNGNFKRVETEVFDKIDELLFSGHGDEEYKEMFNEILVSLCQQSELLKSATGFIDNVTRLIALLLDYRSVPSDDANRGRRMGCMLNLLHFYKDIEKEELYIKYIYKLTELHEKDQSHTEAGFTLLLHAKGLEWTTDNMVAAAGKFPAQTVRERKEQLYMSAIQLFDKGKTWECGIPLCKELAHLYETEMFDYTKLASILQREAEFFCKIIDIQQLRVAPEYFMVGYYAKGFPLFLRNKIFIHRGQPYEKLGAFIKRLTDEYTNAEVLKTTTPPDSDKQNSNGMYLQVRTVIPVAKQHEKFKGKRVPDKIAEYYQSNEVQEFRYDRPFHKGQKNKECEFASLWIDRTTFTTVDSFPGVISWFEVSEVKEVELDPLAIALETVDNKNQEIQLQTAIYSADRSLSINPLSMLLNGVIDAAVMGGIGNYEKIFFNPSYVSENPNDADRVKRLRSLIEEQVMILEKALALHGQLIDQQLQGFHAKLEQCFEDFQCIVFPERRKPKPAKKVTRSATIARPLPPTPGISGPPVAPSASHATMPNRSRRSTGIPGMRHKVQTYEETEIDQPPSFPKVTRKASSPSPSPYHGGPRKGRESSPKIPSPYQGKKQLGTSPSAGDISELSKRFSSSLHSSSSSLNQLSDEGDTNYEPIADFLKEREESVTLSVPQPKAAETGPTTFSPPSYPAPSPPRLPPKKSRAAREQFDEAEENDDDGYTQVNLEGGQVSIEGYSDDVERAVLPLLSSSSTRSSVGGDSNASNSPMKGDHRREAPVTGGASLQSRGEMSSAGVSGTSLSGRVGSMVIPPEPTSPPPSPPMVGQSPTPPIPIGGKAPSPLLSRQNLTGGTSPSASPPTADQPNLPPKKKRHAYSSVSSSVQEDGNDIYSFDTLAPSLPTSISKPTTPPPYVQGPSVDDEIYTFDTLEKAPPVPSKAVKTPVSSTPVITEEPFQPSFDDSNIYEFDNLEEKPPIPQKPAGPVISAKKTSLTGSADPGSMVDPPPIPRKAGGSRPSISEPQQQSYQYQDDPDVYTFDNLEPETPTPKSAAAKPKTIFSVGKPQVQMFDDSEIYTFDNLEPQHGTGGTAQNLSPETGQSGDPSQSDVHDDVYFDHLVTGQRPALPSKYAGKLSTDNSPGLPPRVSPPSMKKNAPPPSSSGSPESAPPVPIKRRGTITKVQSTDDSADSPDSKPHPMPRPRGNTTAVNKSPIPSRPPKPPAPLLPPKALAPNLPPKSKPSFKANGDPQSAPPIPAKNSNITSRWPPQR